MKKINCDVVVVGAGPGGSMAAKTCAKFGLDTVLVERKEKPGKPNAMICLAGQRLFDFVRINEKTTNAWIKHVIYYFSNGKTSVWF
jgi:digeranylgeranylglycerophospholipid reductase